MSIEDVKKQRDAVLALGAALVREDVFEAAQRSAELEDELKGLYATLARAFGLVAGLPRRIDIDKLIEATRPKDDVAGDQQARVMDLLPLTPPALALDDLARALYGEPLAQGGKDAARRVADKLVKRGLVDRVKLGTREVGYLRTAKPARLRGKEEKEEKD